MVQVCYDYQELIHGIPGYDPLATPRINEFVFDADKADSALDFFPRFLTHSKGHLSGEPFELAKWQQAVVANTYGWVHRKTGLRRYREVFIYTPRKNGKSLFAAGMALTNLVLDKEPGFEIYSLACESEQARLIFKMAKAMINNNPSLSDCFEINKNEIYYYPPHLESKYQGEWRVLTSDADSKHGFNTHFASIDEVHAHKSRDLTDVITTSTGARLQPLVVYTTTADFMRPSLCNELVDQAIKVRDGVFDQPSFLPVLYHADREDDWEDPDVWYKANPCLGISFREEYLEQEFAKAKSNPEYENTFKRLFLNIQTEQAVRWMPLHIWDNGNDLPPLEYWNGKPCMIGIDLSSTRDLTAVMLEFWEEDDDEKTNYFWYPYIFAPKDNAEKRASEDKVPYLTWAKQGYMELTEGNSVDYRRVRQVVDDALERFDVQKIGYDPWNAHQFIQQLQDDGFENVVKVPQNAATMNEPMKNVFDMLEASRMHHGGHPVLRWNASNIVVRTDSNTNIRPDRNKSSDKIDGFVAGLNSHALVIRRESEPVSPYETEGITFV